MAIETKLVNLTAGLHKATLRMALKVTAFRDVARLRRVNDASRRAAQLRRVAEELIEHAAQIKIDAGLKVDSARVKYGKDGMMLLSRANELQNALDDVRTVNA